MSNEVTDNKKLESLRREYRGQKLLKDEVAPDPIGQFSKWFDEALNAELPDVNAMTLATASREGKPSARVVLLKGFDEKGFRFYTNYNSRKGKEIESNPYATICFYWAKLDRQVRIEGKVSKISRKKSAEYFNMRPRESRLSAWASPQSEVLDDRGQLEMEYQRVKQKFDGQEIPTPEFWGGYLLTPDAIEFWQGRPGRLHDRILYRKGQNRWIIERLSP